MTKDMLILDTVSCIVVAITMPAFTIAFFGLGFMILKVLRIFFKGQFNEKEKSIKKSIWLLGMSTLMVSLRFLLEAFF
jgi:hypothetical protein